MSDTFFRSRHPDRDAEADALRFEMLCDEIAMVEMQICREAKGLRARYEKAICDAGFLFQNMEQGRGAGNVRRLDELGADIKRCPLRLRALEDQLALLHRVRQMIEDFAGVSREPRLN